MKKTVKFLACIFAISAFAVACNNNAPEEQPADTADTELVCDTPEVIDTPAVDSTAVETPATTTTTSSKKGNKDNTVQRSDPKQKLDAGSRDLSSAQVGGTATKTNMQDEALKDRNKGKMGK